MAEGELWIIRADHVDLIAADEDLIAQFGPFERFDCPIQNPPAAYGGVALGLAVGHALEPAAATGADDDGFHYFDSSLIGAAVVWRLADAGIAFQNGSKIN